MSFQQFNGYGGQARRDNNKVNVVSLFHPGDAVRVSFLNVSYAPVSHGQATGTRDGADRAARPCTFIIVFTTMKLLIALLCSD